MNEGNLVHEEWGHILVKAKKLPGYYRVVYGTVNWSGKVEDMLPALVVLIQNDDTEDFDEAKSEGVIYFLRPAHIMAEDIDAVAKAMVELKKRYLGKGGAP